MKKIAEWAKRALSSKKRGSSQLPFAAVFRKFQEILAMNNQVLELIAGANDKLGGDYVFDQQYVHATCREVSELVQKLIYNLDTIAPNKYLPLHDVFQRIQEEIELNLEGRLCNPATDFIMPYDRIGRDFVDAVGGKNANLAELHTFLGLQIPSGFAITTAAFQAFMERNRLERQLEEITHEWLQNKIPVTEASAKIQALIMAGNLPAKLEKEMKVAFNKFIGPDQTKELFLAVRSSAWGEDSEHTFAGQYLTMLNVPAAGLADYYRQVLASAYSEGAMEYRRVKGFDAKEVAMSVACQQMVDAKVSGVIYTFDPLSPEKETMLLAATWGLGAPVVSGRVSADQFTVERQAPHRTTEIKVVRKEKALGLRKKGGTMQKPVPVDLQTSACLTNEQVKRLAEIALSVEKYFKKPQDIEFTIDQEDRIVILQARQLAVKSQKAPRASELAALVKKYPVVFRNKGVIAQKGIGTGKVFLVKDEKDLQDFPEGAILVAKYASPLLAKVITRVSGIITDVGSATGHMATIAREFRVPCILNTGIATERLVSDQEITLDADENVVYEGIVKELRYYSLEEESIEETYEYRLLRRVLKKIEPLHLLDPSERSFVPAGCKSLHDITRFVHEKSVEELIDLNYYHSHDPRTVAGKLQWDIPLDMVMIDIGGGLLPGKTAKIIKLEEILSVPMQALLNGLGQRGAWDNEPMSVDFGSFMSSLTRTFSAEHANPKNVGQNLAVVSREYANVSLRLGYHFTMIDAYVSENINDNYAYFRFFGGVTDTVRRSRRAKFLGEVLASNDFRVELHGDLVVARIKKFDAESMRQRLYLLGLLVGFTRQLDVKMISDGRIDEYIEKFNHLLEVKYEQ
jgi:pyruvate,water dikinase